MKKLLVYLLMVSNGFGATWYFDVTNNAVADGTTWDKAWTNWAGVTWASINPGDTIRISGGTGSKSYNEDIVISEDGSSSNWLYIKNGQETGHNGVIDMGTNVLRFADFTPNWVDIDFGRDPTFVAPTTVFQLTNSSINFTSNIGYWSHDRLGGVLANTSPAHSYFTEGVNNLRFRWMRFSGYSNTVSGAGTGLEPRGTIFYIDIDPSEPLTNIVFQYNWFHDNVGQVFSANGQNNASVTNGVDVSFNIIERNGEDHFEGARGFSIHDNIIGPAKSFTGGVHCDFFQLTGYTPAKIYNNIIWESYNAIMRVQAFGVQGGPNPNTNEVGGVWFYNNMIIEKPGNSLHGGTLVEPFILTSFNHLHVSSLFLWTNMLFANNLFYRSLSNTAVSPAEWARNSLIQAQKGDAATNGKVVNFKWVNNIVVDKHNGAGLFLTTNANITKGFWPYTTNEVWIDYNSHSTFSGDAWLTTPKYLGFLDEDILDGSSAYSFSNNTNTPTFVDYATNYTSFELASTDTVALNKGYDLSAYFSTDMLNRPRGALWSRGPLESDAGLILYYSFDNDTAGGNATDDSGNGYTSYRFNLTEYSYPSNKNYNASGAPGLLYRPNFTGKYMDFLWRTNNGTYNPTYLTDGAIFGTTNAHNTITNLGEFTVMVWGYYDTLARTDFDPAHPSYDYSKGAYEHLIGASTANAATSVGSFSIGRFNQQINANETRCYIQTNTSSTGSWGSYGDPVFGNSGKVVFNFGDTGTQNSLGKLTNWHHYCMTFSNGIAKTYMNGIALATNDMSANCTKIKLGKGTTTAYSWFALGGNPHDGTPQFDFVESPRYPNNAWLNGAIDQPRMYERCLSWQEIVDIANAEGAEFADAPAESGETVVAGTSGKLINIIKRRR